MTETFRFMARRISETPDEVLMFSFSLLSFVGIILVAYWFYNRRRIHQLSHQIPASVVKNYLDSIIQNSSALKSSLFRGGGLDVGEGVPSVMPIGDLPQGNVGVSSGASSEELNQKIAEIASLSKRLADKDVLIKELESKLDDMPSSPGKDQSEEVEMLKGEIKRLKAELADQSSAAESSDDSELQDQLKTVTQERDELKERLMEYEIIEEDLANLKRLQQENEQLKNQLAGAGKEVEQAPVEEAKEEPKKEEPTPEPEKEEPKQEEAPAAEASAEEEDDEDLEAAMASAIGTPDEEAEQKEEPAAEAAPEKENSEDTGKDEKKEESNDSDQKSAEELLSEFEKMLG